VSAASQTNPHSRRVALVAIRRHLPPLRRPASSSACFDDVMMYTQEQLTTIEAAIAEGALTVKYGDKQVTYRSLDEMLRIRGMMREELGTNANATGGVVYPRFSKGLNSHCTPNWDVLEPRD
jgi:hypothetical protein